MAVADAVIGHCVASGLLGRAVDSWSSKLFSALASDELRVVDSLLLAGEAQPAGERLDQCSVMLVTVHDYRGGR